MPHRCIACGNVVRKGSKALIDGCPECGGLKFAYQPMKRDSRKSMAPASKTSQKPRPSRRRSRKIEVKKEVKEPLLESFESVRLVGEGTYAINIKNILAGEQFVLGLEDGRYYIPIERKIPK